MALSLRTFVRPAGQILRPPRLWMALGVPPGPGASVEYALPGVLAR
jgi:hypothetical protein